MILPFISRGCATFAGLNITPRTLLKAPPLLRTDFDTSLAKPAPPEECGSEITALWWLCNRNWQQAHDVIDGAPGRDAAWIHGLLHLMEGDRANAGYWYARAGRSQEGATIGQEVDLLLAYFLE